MSDAPAAPVTEQGAPPVTQSEEVPSFKVTRIPSCCHFPPSNTSQVFVGNLAYSTTDEGLKAFFEPVQSDMCDFFSLFPCLIYSRWLRAQPCLKSQC